MVLPDGLSYKKATSTMHFMKTIFFREISSVAWAIYTPIQSEQWKCSQILFNCALLIFKIKEGGTWVCVLALKELLIY